MKATTIGIALAIGSATCAAAAENAPAQYDAIIARHAAATGVPEALIRRVIVRESKYNPRAMHAGHFGMMQIKPATAKSMGYSGSAAGLLDADTNLTYGVRYLAGAYRVARGDHDRSVRLYASGYYYDAKRAGMLAQIGMGRDGNLRGASATAAPNAPDVQIASIATPSAPVSPSVPLPLARGPAPAHGAVQTASIATPAVPAIPVPPVRGAAPFAQVASAVPVPPAREGAAQQRVAARMAAPAARVIAAGTAPVLASAAPLSAAPVPAARDAGPATTGSIAAARAAAPSVPLPNVRDAGARTVVASAAPIPTQRAAVAAVQPRTIAIQAPVLASAGPVAAAKPYPPIAPVRPAALAYAGSGSAVGDEASSQLRSVRAPMPPRR